MRSVAISLIVLLALSLQAQSPPELFADAQEAYDNGEYTRAINLYQQVLGQGMESGPVHYNLGNAYFRAGELGEAILHWEKARQLNPRDQDVQFNLKVGRARIQDRIEAPESSFLIQVFNGIKYRLTLNELGWSVGALFLLAGLAFAGWRLLPLAGLKRTAWVVLVVSIVLLLLSGPLLASRLMEVAREDYGIILSKEVRARSGPQEFSTEVFILHEGTRVQVEARRDRWYQIRLADGKEGWIPRTDLGII